jgi:hypothetical protein
MAKPSVLQTITPMDAGPSTSPSHTLTPWTFNYMYGDACAWLLAVPLACNERCWVDCKTAGRGGAERNTQFLSWLHSIFCADLCVRVLHAGSS